MWAGVVALGYVTLMMDWAGDSWEVGRHSVEGTIGVALAGLMLLGCHRPDPEPLAPNREGVEAGEARLEYVR
jgi:hypothetical protein